MMGKYFLLGVDDISYTKNGQFCPYYAYYLRNGDGHVVVRKSSEKFVDDLNDQVVASLPRVAVTIKEVTTKTGSFIALESVKEYTN